MLRALSLLCLLLPACDAVFRLDHLSADARGSISVDSSSTGIDAYVPPCVGKMMGKNGGTTTAPKGMFSTCVPDGEADVQLTGALDTSTSCDVTTESNGIPVCVKYGGTIKLSALTVTGTRALVIATQGTITIAGTIDVRNRGSGNAGCTNTPGTPDPNGGSGGAGGGFATLGGHGGASGKAGGIAGGPQNTPTELRFGCAGKDGGGDAQVAGGIGGPSGGTIYLIANDIDIMPTGGIDASGEGGVGGQLPTTGGGGGGGGGGSGGLIGFDAVIIKTTAGATGAFSANGGGGGGGNNNIAGTGARTLTTSTAGPAGGMGGANSGNGGAGGAGAVEGSAGGDKAATVHGTGGGGGGGTGWFVIYARTNFPSFTSPSPAPVVGS